jgi:hypothetical protein
LTDIVVTGGSGAGRALAAGADSSPAARAPAAAVAAQARLVVLNLRKCMGPSSVAAAAPRKLDLFTPSAKRDDRKATNFVLTVDKRPRDRYRLTSS